LQLALYLHADASIWAQPVLSELASCHLHRNRSRVRWLRNGAAEARAEVALWGRLALCVLPQLTLLLPIHQRPPAALDVGPRSRHAPQAVQHRRPGTALLHLAATTARRELRARRTRHVLAAVHDVLATATFWVCWFAQGVYMIEHELMVGNKLRRDMRAHGLAQALLQEHGSVVDAALAHHPALAADHSSFSAAGAAVSTLPQPLHATAARLYLQRSHPEWCAPRHEANAAAESATPPPLVVSVRSIGALLLLAQAVPEMCWLQGAELRVDARASRGEQCAHVFGDVVAALASLPHLRSLQLHEASRCRSAVISRRFCAARAHLASMTGLTSLHVCVSAPERMFALLPAPRRSDAIAVLAPGIAKLSNLQALHLPGSGLDCGAACALAAALVQLRSITCLQLQRNAIADTGACALAAGIAAQTGLHELNISRNRIGVNGAHGACALARACMRLTALASLDLARNRCPGIVVGQACPALTRLDLSGCRNKRGAARRELNELRDSDAFAVARARAEGTGWWARLRELRVCAARGVLVLAALHQAQHGGMARLASLALDDMPLAASKREEFQYAHGVAGALQRLTALTHLSLARHSFRFEAAILLSQAISGLPWLECVNFDGGAIHTHSPGLPAIVLAYCLADASVQGGCTTLTRLSLCGYPSLLAGGVQTGDMLSGFLAALQPLRSLALADCGISGKPAQALLRHVPQLTQLQELDLRRNDLGLWGDACAPELHALVASAPQVTVQLDGNVVGRRARRGLPAHRLQCDERTQRRVGATRTRRLICGVLRAVRLPLVFGCTWAAAWHAGQAGGRRAADAKARREAARRGGSTSGAVSDEIRISPALGALIQGRRW
jgi:hypothetical protein